MSRFRPGAGATLATAVGLGFFLSLGFWQLDRAEQKAALFEQFAEGQAPWPQQRALAAIGDGADLRFRRVRLSGRYEPARQLLLDGMVGPQGAGAHVLTPFRLDTGQLIAVNRGWVALTAQRQPPPGLDVAAMSRTLTGRLAPFPRPGLRLGESPVWDADAPWPRVALFPTPEQYAAMLGEQLLAWQLWLDPGEPDGFQRDWKVAEFGPERHLGYAVQWFAFGVVLMVIYVVTNWKKRRPAP